MFSGRPQFTTPRELSCNGRTLVIGKKTLIMGILNVTPDSFSDGGTHNEVEAAVNHALKMIDEGADLIDVGGESTRPGGAEVSLEEELERVIPVIQALVNHPGIQVPISIDTYKAEVARQALAAGAHLINDVWGFQREPEMAKVAATYKVPAVVMHNQVGTAYSDDLVSQMRSFFDRTLEIAKEAGMDPDYLILDPGIGFGKTPDQNIELMSRLGEFSDYGLAILLGTSRKSMIGKILDLPPNERLEGTLATNVLGIAQGVELIRVHDIQAHYRAVKVADAILRREING